MRRRRGRQVEDADDENRRRQVRRVLDAMPVPETMPAFGRLHIDDLGHIWVQDYRAPGDEAVAWAEFDPQGLLVARATLPDRFDPIRIGRDFVPGVWRDPFDVEHLRLHRLTRS